MMTEEERVEIRKIIAGYLKDHLRVLVDVESQYANSVEVCVSILLDDETIHTNSSQATIFDGDNYGYH